MRACAAQRALADGREEQVARLLQERVDGAREAVDEHPAGRPEHRRRGARRERVDASLEDEGDADDENLIEDPGVDEYLARVRAQKIRLEKEDDFVWKLADPTKPNQEEKNLVRQGEVSQIIME